MNGMLFVFFAEKVVVKLLSILYGLLTESGDVCSFVNILSIKESRLLCLLYSM